MSKIEDALDKLSLCVAHHNNNEVSDEDLYKEIANVKATLSAIVPEGSVVVPREASEEMKSAGAGHVNSCPCMLAFDLLSDAEFVWDAMIKASEGA